jgi:copper resistance protein D
MLLTGTSMGTAWQLRMAALTAALILSPFLHWRPGIALPGIVLATAVALATLAWTGHGAASEGVAGWTHLASDIIHLIASAAWLGALVALIVLIFKPARKMSAEHLSLSHDALAGFSTVGTILVALILLSGLINGWMLVGPSHLGAMFTTLYGRLLLAKLLLFAAMLGLAASNRFRLTPALERTLRGSDHGAAVAALRKSLALETGAAVLILGLVAWLGTLEPPAAAV